MSNEKHEPKINWDEVRLINSEFHESVLGEERKKIYKEIYKESLIDNVVKGNDQAVKVLLRKGSSYFETEDLYEAMLMAAKKGYLKIFYLLIGKEKDNIYQTRSKIDIHYDGLIQKVKHKYEDNKEIQKEKQAKLEEKRDKEHEKLDERASSLNEKINVFYPVTLQSMRSYSNHSIFSNGLFESSIGSIGAAIGVLGLVCFLLPISICIPIAITVIGFSIGLIASIKLLSKEDLSENNVNQATFNM